MYTRYSDSKIKKDPFGQRYLSQTIYPEIPVSEDDIYIISVRGDRLDLFAKRFLEDVSLWYVIAQANNLGSGTLTIPPGLQIRIPSISSIPKIKQDFIDLNNI